MGYPDISWRLRLLAKRGRKVRYLVFTLALSTLLSGFLVNLHDLSHDVDLAGCTIGTLVLDQSATLPVPPPPLLRPAFLFFLVVVSRRAAVSIFDISIHDGRPPPAISPA